MQDILEIYNSNNHLGIVTRKTTEGEEIDLVRQFIDYRKQLFIPKSDKKLGIFVEPKINDSYPDIVFVEYDPNNYENWNKNRLKLSAYDLRILYHIYISKSIDSTKIVNQLGISWKDVTLAIENLYDSNLITRKNKKWAIKEKKSICVRKIEAVEAKINKLDEVFQQAIINKNFASESYALLKVNKSPKQEKLELFEKFGLGMYLKKNNGFATIKVANKSSIPISFNSLYFNEWIGRAIFLAKGDAYIDIKA